MDQKIFQGESESERVTILKDSCEKMEEFTYPKSFPKEEIIKKKDEVVFKTDQLFKLKERKKETVSVMNAEIKELQTEQATLVHEVTSGREDITGQVYLVSDQDEGVMGYYSKDGELVYHRPLLPTERQISMLTKVKSS